MEKFAYEIKVGDKLNVTEQQLLKAILITRIAGFSFYDKEDACLAFRYCSNLKEQNKILEKKLYKENKQFHSLLLFYTCEIFIQFVLVHEIADCADKAIQRVINLVI